MYYAEMRIVIQMFLMNEDISIYICPMYHVYACMCVFVRVWVSDVIH